MSEAFSSRTRRFGCPSCGGGLQYDISSGMMLCDRCGGRTPLDHLPDDSDAEARGSGTMQVTEFHCPQCGAVVYSTDTSVTGFCSFCGSDVVLTGKLGHTLRPKTIVPFTITREDCEARYRDHLKHFHLTPASLKSAETIGHFRPVYVPFWVYGVESSGAAELKGAKSYTKGNYRYSEEYKLLMHADIDQKDILYDASTAFEDETAAMLQHTAADAVPFHAAYLSGFYAQASNVPAETYQDEAAATAVRLFMARVKAEYGMDSVEMAGNIGDSFGLPNARYTQQLTMMPVWLLAHRTGDRVVYTAINGRSGQVVCDVPVSTGKVAGVALALAAGLFALLHLFVTLKPDMLMLFCALLLLITQYQFSSAQKLLQNRRTRAFEPDFTGAKATFTGPAQAMLKRTGTTVAMASGIKEKAKQVSSIAFSVIIVIFFTVLSRAQDLLRSFSPFSGASGRMFMLIGMAILTVVMVIHVLRKAKTGGTATLIPRVVSCVACAAGTIFLALGQVEDLLYYACAAAMLAAACWELVIINRAHNEYASRPVPFFGEEAAS